MVRAACVVLFLYNALRPCYEYAMLALLMAACNLQMHGNALATHVFLAADLPMVIPRITCTPLTLMLCALCFGCLVPCRRIPHIIYMHFFSVRIAACVFFLSFVIVLRLYKKRF
jgi:ABC-type spermidine/putrescine transport system permease subunit II